MQGSRSTKAARIAAVASVGATFAAFGVVVVGASTPARDKAADRLEAATAPLWPATAALSKELDALDEGESRVAARKAARALAAELEATEARIGRLDLPVSATPLLNSVEHATRSIGHWVDAAGSVLANPRSTRREGLPIRASDAATAVSRLSTRIPAAENTVRGTGHLLSALDG